MRWLKKIMVLVLVALWSLASNHCKIEQLIAFEFLDCCNVEVATDHTGSDCDTDGCASLEGGVYKTEDGQLAIHAPALLNIIAPPLGEKFTSSTPQICFAAVLPPPELSVRWQFISRAAASPRFPSFVS